MNPVYLWAKFLKKIRSSAIKDSIIHKTSKVEAGSSVIDSKIGRYTFCGYDCTIINCDIGSFCSISNNVVIGGARHPMEWVSMSPVFSSRKDSVKKKFSKHFKEYTPKTYIGNDVWIGERALIKAGIKIGDGAVIGMGSVVTNDIEPYSIMGGCPARILRRRFDNEKINDLLEIKWWEFNDNKLKKYAGYFTNPDTFISKVKK